MSSNLHFRTPLSGEEHQFYDSKFRELDPESLGIVTGEAVRPLLASSGLSSHSLSQIWSLVDTNNKGFLSLSEFSGALRMIGHLQLNPAFPVSADLYSKPPARLASFTGSTGGQATGPPQRSVSTAFLDVPSANDVAKYSELFDRSSGGTGQISGVKAREIFMKANLDTQTLGQIWALCDRGAKGYLDKSEFVISMHLLQLAITKHPAMNPPPSAIPPHFWNMIRVDTTGSSNMVPSVQQTPLSAHSTGRSSIIGRQPSLSRISSGAFTNASEDWTLSPEKKQQFDLLFDSLNKNHRASLGSQVLVPFFVSSKLSQDTLATIWDLADIYNNAEFTKVEFAIAMFLIQKKNAGVELPDVIPDQLLNSPALALNIRNPQNSLGNPSVSRRSSYIETQPASMQNQQISPLPVPQPAPVQIAQNSNNGSLSDLLALNDSFSTPSKQGTDNNHSMPPPTMQPRKHASTSNFAQDVIREEDEYQPQLQQQPLGSFGAQTSLPQKAAPPPVPVHRQPSVSLKNVPTFNSMNMATSAVGTAASSTAGAITGLAAGAVSGIMHKNTDLYADAAASAQLSTATTELANLSNQVNSLTKQASVTTEKKNRVSKELKKIQEVKATITQKLENLRAQHQKNTAQNHQLETTLAQTKQENIALKQQLQTVETNYQTLESQLKEINENLNNAQLKNNDLKDQIMNYNGNLASLRTQLVQKQQEYKNIKASNDESAKGLDLDKFTAAALGEELGALTEKLKVYTTKHKELDDYQKTLEQRHTEIESKIQKLDAKNNDLVARESQLAERTKQMDDQENLYGQHVQKLDGMFEDLNNNKKAFTTASESLNQQHVEHAQNIHSMLYGKDEDSEEVEQSTRSLNENTYPSPDCKVGEKDTDTQPPKNIVEKTVQPSKETLFSVERHIPGDWDTQNKADLSISKDSAASAYSDTSDDDEKFQDTREDFLSTYDEMRDSVILNRNSEEDAEDTSEKPDEQSMTNIKTHSEETFEVADKAVAQTSPGVPKLSPEPTFVAAPNPSQVDDLDDEFAGLEQTAVEVDDQGDDNSSFEDFENIDAKDLNRELEENNFSGFDYNQSNAKPETDDWENLFAGFGNAKPAQDQGSKLSESNMTKATPQQISQQTKPKATGLPALSPKDIAVEELSGMGFSREEAIKALEQSNWQLDAATNRLLDGS